MNKHFVLIFAVLLTTPFFVNAQIASDIRITPNGLFSAKNLTVIQKAGSTIFARGTWGTTYLRIGILTNASTSIAKHHGEKILINEIVEGHVIDVDGTLVVSTENILLNATKIRNVSLQNESKQLSGTVSTVDAADLSFTLANTSFGTTKIKTSVATIKKGSRTLSVSELVKGDKVLTAVGTYDFPTNVMTASEINVFQPKEKFVTKNFEGTLKAVAGTVAPTTLTLTVGDKEYTVNLSDKTAILNNKKGKTSLTRFAAGDKVRVYGTVGDYNPSVIVAEVVRDLSF